MKNLSNTEVEGRLLYQYKVILYTLNLYKSLFLWLAQGTYKNPTWWSPPIKKNNEKNGLTECIRVIKENTRVIFWFKNNRMLSEYWHTHLLKLVLTLGCPWMAMTIVICINGNVLDIWMPKCISGHLNVKVKLRGEGLLVVDYSRIVFLRNYSLKSHHQRVHLSLSIKGNIHCVTQGGQITPPRWSHSKVPLSNLEPQITDATRVTMGDSTFQLRVTLIGIFHWNSKACQFYK